MIPIDDDLKLCIHPNGMVARHRYRGYRTTVSAYEMLIVGLYYAHTLKQPRVGAANFKAVETEWDRYPLIWDTNP